ncbi:hypothetical protein ACFLVR_03975 [Chloroflexota bacterium]
MWGIAKKAVANIQQVTQDVIRQRSRYPNNVTQQDFLRECAWAVLVAGMKVRAIEMRWDALQNAFMNWDCSAIRQNKHAVYGEAIGIFGNKRKISAIINIAKHLDKYGWNSIKSNLLAGSHKDKLGNLIPSPQLLTSLQQLPQVGEVSAIFIAKNLGFDLAKPDVWLLRLTSGLDYGDSTDAVQQMAYDISQLVGERIGVVETILWNACRIGTNLNFLCTQCGNHRKF